MSTRNVLDCDRLDDPLTDGNVSKVEHSLTKVGQNHQLRLDNGAVDFQEHRVFNTAHE